MKIFLPFSVQDIGGTSTFARKFQHGMEQAGHTVFFDYQEDYDILFLIVQAPLKYLLEAKRRRVPIVQRLDGTWYWSVAGWRFPLLNAKAAFIRHFFTTYTIYQSRYSRECANRFLGKKTADRSTIIFNGVDLRHFSPAGQKAEKLRDNPTQQLFFTASAFRRPDQIMPLIEAATAYRQKYGSNFKILIAGSFTGRVKDIPKRYKDFPNLVFLGKINNPDLPAYERAADAFLFTHLNPPCPNNVIEALGCGLPVCGIADGAMPELITHRKNGLLALTVGTGFWRPRQHDNQVFADNMAKILTTSTEFKTSARQSAEKRFSLPTMIDGYVKTFQDLLK